VVAVSLEGRVVIITGAARGLGRAYVEHLLACGAMVVATDIDGAALSELAEELSAERLRTAWGDAADAQHIAEVVAVALSMWGHLDGVVANAGLLRSGPILRADPTDADVLLGVHVKGPFLLVREAGRYWRGEAKAGRARQAAAVLTTSSAGLYGFRGEALYSAAKAAVAAFTLVAADELGRYGATVNAVAPVARTRLTEWLDDSADGGGGVDRYDPAHVAPLVGWLLADTARDVTGRIFEAGGGSIALVDGWRPVVERPLPDDPAAQDPALFESIMAAAPVPRSLLVADATLMTNRDAATNEITPPAKEGIT
jgi:NAD(P)-dependent dehydrogenase (short-subunit alcohol dehydrogenase family)